MREDAKKAQLALKESKKTFNITWNVNGAQRWVKVFIRASN